MTEMYWGFFGNGYSGFGDALDATEPYGNLNWIDCDSVNALNKTRSQGKKAIVNVSTLIYPHYPSITVQNDVGLKSWWDSIEDYHELIVGLLIADEPWRTNEKHVGLPGSIITGHLNTGGLIVAEVTGKPSLVCASGPEFDKYDIPSSVNWLGMYRYSYNTHWMLLYYSFANLVRRKSSYQRIFAIADAYEKPGVTVDSYRIINMNKSWRQLISWWPSHVIGVAPFLYQTSAMGQGASNMPRVLADLYSWSQQSQSGV